MLCLLEGTSIPGHGVEEEPHELHYGKLNQKRFDNFKTKTGDK
jgi:hypothetical protein